MAVEPKIRSGRAANAEPRLRSVFSTAVTHTVVTISAAIVIEEVAQAIGERVAGYLYAKV